MKLPSASEAGPARPWFSRQSVEGGASIAWASAAPLIVLLIAVASDRAQVSHFRTQVQLAADAASLASVAMVERQVDSGGVGAAAETGAAVFARNAPRGAAGSPRVTATSRGPVATATIDYDAVAPSNFGSALGYGAFRVSASATRPALLTDSRTAPRP